MFVLSLKLAIESLKQRMVSRVVVVLTSACLLMIAGVFIVGLKSFSTSIADISRSQSITVYLEPSLEVEKEEAVLSAVKKIHGVHSTTLVGKENFLENFQKFFPELSKDLASIDNDAIPRFIKVQTQASSLSFVEASLKKIKGVEAAETNQMRYSGLISALEILKKISLVLIAGLSIATLSLLFNHARNSNSFRSQLSKTLRSLGARKDYLFIPVVFESLSEAALSGVLAAVALSLLGGKITVEMNQLFLKIGYRPIELDFHTASMNVVAMGVVAGVLVAASNMFVMEKSK